MLCISDIKFVLNMSNTCHQIPILFGAVEYYLLTYKTLMTQKSYIKSNILCFTNNNNTSQTLTTTKNWESSPFSPSYTINYLSVCLSETIRYYTNKNVQKNRNSIIVSKRYFQKWRRCFDLAHVPKIPWLTDSRIGGMNHPITVNL